MGGIVIALVVIVILAVLGTLGVTSGFLAFKATNGDADPNGDCETAPVLTDSVKNALEQGTAVSVDRHYFLNGVYFGVTEPSSYSVDDEVQLIINVSGFIDISTDKITMECGNNKMTKDGKENILIFDHSDATITIKEDSVTLSDSTSGANNASNIVAGGSDTYEVCFTGTDKDTTGIVLYAVELGSTANVSDISMYKGEVNLKEVKAPDFYENTLTSPKVQGFIVPAIEGAKEVCYSLTVSAKSGKDIAGAVYTTAYTGQAFVEDDGSLTEWGIEQIDGDITYESTYDYDFVISNA